MRLSPESLPLKRAARLAACAAVCLGAVGVALPAAAAVGAAQGELRALGLIVKLKDKVPQPLVKLKVAQVPSDGAASQRARLYASAGRQRVGFTAHKATAFGAHLIHSGALSSVEEAEAEAARLRLDPDVEWVVVNRFEKQASVSPINVASQLGSNTGGYSTHFWAHPVAAGREGVAGFETAWASIAARPSVSPVVVAVLDTGKLEHPDVTGRILPGYDFVSQHSNDGDGLDGDPTDPGDYMATAIGDCKQQNSSWHGFSIISMLTAPHDSGKTAGTQFGPGILSPLPGAQVLPVRIGGGCGALLSDIVEGMLWASGVDYQGSPYRNPNPARVINLSFGSEGSCLTSSSTDVLYRQTIATLTAKGVLVVASAGNGDGNTGYTSPSRPASCPGVMAVTGLRANGAKAVYANLVNGVPASAGYHGIAVVSGDRRDGAANKNLNLLMNGGQYSATSDFRLDADFTCLYSGVPGPCVSEGTSFAVPQVVGVAALMMAVAPNLSGSQVRDIIMNTARTHTTPGGATCSATAPTQTGACQCTTATCGKGILDANAAVTQAIAQSSTIPYSSSDLSADYFRPSRLTSSSGGGGGGGGGAADLGMLAFLAGVITWMLAAWAWPRLSALQAVPEKGQAVKSGKR